VMLISGFLKTYGEKIRAFGIILFCSPFVIFLILFISGLMEWNIQRSAPYLYPSMIFLFHLIPVDVILYFAPAWLYHLDYHTQDFGFFSTKIHNSFEDPWKSSFRQSPDGEFIVFNTTGRFHEFTYTKDTRISPTHVMRSRIRKTSLDFFYVYCFFFNSEDERAAKELEIVKKYEYEEEHCSASHFPLKTYCLSFSAIHTAKIT
jgi:hypothetical protein